MRLLAIAAIWLVAAAASLLLAWQTAIGPVLWVLQGGRHGVHLGDLVGVVAAVALATLATLRLMQADRAARR